MKNTLALFEEKEIRKVWIKDRWYFSVVDIVFVLTDSKDPKQYVKKLKLRDIELQNKWGTICTLLETKTIDGRNRKIQMSDTKGILRIIQSIPSPKAEPFKLWLARVGSERIEEISNPEIAMNRMKRIYEKKGYSKSWIRQREKGIISRQNLTDEWKSRGVVEKKEYSILTNEIYKSGFGYTTKEYKKIKNITKNKNLRDSMTNIELALTNLGEVAAIELHIKNNSNGLDELKSDMNKAGKVINKAKKELESELNERITDKKLIKQTN